VGGPLFQFTIRDFSLTALVRTPRLSPTLRRIFVNGSLLPFNYLLEFGLFFLVAHYKWQQHRAGRRPLSRHDLALAILALVSTLVCTFMKSGVIGNNDLGWRGFLFAQFVLLIWAVEIFGQRDRLEFLNARRKQLLTVFFALGFAGTVTDLALVRLYPVLADRGVVPPLDWMSPDRDLGHRLYAARTAYDWLRRVTPDTAAVQANPKPNPAQQDVIGMTYAERPTIAGDLSCHAGFGGDLTECAPLVSRLTTVFPAGSGSAAFYDACHSLPLDSIVVKDTDPVWSDPQSWVWTEHPSYANPYVRIFRCSVPHSGRLAANSTSP
jgi:hypothetical protein